MLSCSQITDLKLLSERLDRSWLNTCKIEKDELNFRHKIIKLCPYPVVSNGRDPVEGVLDAVRHGLGLQLECISQDIVQAGGHVFVWKIDSARTLLNIQN